jgi:hypothetical protein
MLTIRHAACRLRVDAFPTRERTETTALNISYTGTIADDRIDAATLDYLDACKAYLGCTFHFVVLIDGTVEIGRNPKTLSSRGRSAARRHDTVFIGVVGGLNFEDGKREDTMTDAQREAVAELEQAIADSLNTPLDVIDFTVGHTGRAEADQIEDAEEIAIEEQLNRAEQAASQLF